MNSFASFNADILDRYVSLIMSSFFPEASHNRKGNYNFRCNICGDSKKSKRKKRAWILKYPDRWIFYCHNCNESLPVDYWMKLHFNSYYNDYIKEAFNLELGDKVTRLPPVVKRVDLTGEEYNEYKDAQYFKPIFSSNAEIFAIARKECMKRLLPLAVWRKWFVATDGIFRNRLVIPYYDDTGKIYNYQCRSLLGQEPKYLSRINSTDNIYNYYCVDVTKPVVILEGAIDSLFIENAVGCTGLRVEDERFKKFPHRFFLLDNDDAGRTMSTKLLKMGEFVFKWGEFLVSLNLTDPYQNPKKNDINDLVMRLNRTERFTFDELKPFFTNSSLDEHVFNSVPIYRRMASIDTSPESTLSKKGNNYYESSYRKEFKKSNSGFGSFTDVVKKTRS